MRFVAFTRQTNQFMATSAIRNCLILVKCTLILRLDKTQLTASLRMQPWLKVCPYLPIIFFNNSNSAVSKLTKVKAAATSLIAIRETYIINYIETALKMLVATCNFKLPANLLRSLPWLGKYRKVRGSSMGRAVICVKTSAEGNNKK